MKHPFRQEDRNTKRKLVCERNVIAWIVSMTCLFLTELNTKHKYRLLPLSFMCNEGNIQEQNPWLQREADMVCFSLICCDHLLMLNMCI